MPYTLRYEPDNNCVVLTFENTVTIENIKEAAPRVARMCEENSCEYLLNDMSAATIDVSFMELYTSPKIMDKSRMSPTIKRALVVPPGFDEAGFLETVTRNKGHNLMVFQDIEEAKRWLCSGV